MAYFFKSGNSYKVSSDSADISSSLPGGNYVVKNNPFTGFFLEISEPFNLPNKIYGNCLRYSNRILETFQRRGKNTGVLLVGEKGSGKTLLMRNVALTSGLPVIIINEPFVGDVFFTFLTAIEQPCIVLFDEFEKVYSDKQSSVLTLLDGTYQSNKLFIISSNNKWKLDENMQNRPGRIFYMLEYDGLDRNFIREYCQENLDDKTKIDGIVSISEGFLTFNFDMLASMVEEINRYNEEPDEVIKMLNIKPEYSGKNNYNLSARFKNHNISSKQFSQNSIELNPYIGKCAVYMDIMWSTEQDDKTLEKINNMLNDDDFEEFTNLLDNDVIQLGVNNKDLPNIHEYEFSIVVGPEKICSKIGAEVLYNLGYECFLILTKCDKALY